MTATPHIRDRALIREVWKPESRANHQPDGQGFLARLKKTFARKIVKIAYVCMKTLTKLQNFAWKFT